MRLHGHKGPQEGPRAEATRDKDRGRTVIGSCDCKADGQQKDERLADHGARELSCTTGERQGQLMDSYLCRVTAAGAVGLSTRAQQAG